MKTILTIGILVCSIASASAQTISYPYAPAGNRIKREVIVLDGGKKSGMENSPVAATAGTGQETAAVHEQQAGSQLVRVYPNPTQGKIMLEITGSNKNASVSVFDMSGKMVFSKKQFGSSGEIDLSRQPNGVYVMKVLVGDKVSEWELVKQ